MELRLITLLFRYKNKGDEDELLSGKILTAFTISNFKTKRRKMRDAQIIEAMNDAKLEKYYLDTSVRDNYDECQKEIDKKLEYFYKRAKEVIADMAFKYDIEHNVILNEMVIPSLQAEAEEK